MSAGKFRWVASVEGPPSGRTSTGAKSGAWRSLFTRRVHVEDVSGSKAQDGVPQQQSVAWYSVTMRLTSLSPTYRLTLTGAPYEGLVVYVVSVRHTLTETTATCVQRGLG